MDLLTRAAAHAALGDPHRLAMVDLLARSDRSPSELSAALRLEPNLLSHHLQALEAAGIVERVRSSGDGRRRYVRLVPGVLRELAATSGAEPPRVVLFVCTANSARSQMAAALWNALATGAAESAGTCPAKRVHPLAIRTLQRHGIDPGRPHPRSIGDVHVHADLVVTVCDRAHEQLVEAAGPWAAHWSVEDPVPAGTPAAFEHAFAAIHERIELLAGTRPAA